MAAILPSAEAPFYRVVILTNESKDKFSIIVVQTYQKGKEVPYMEMSRDNDQKRKEYIYMEVSRDTGAYKSSDL